MLSITAPDLEKMYRQRPTRSNGKCMLRWLQAVGRLDRVMASSKGRDVLISDTRLVLALRGITQKATNLESRLAS